MQRTDAEWDAIWLAALLFDKPSVGQSWRPYVKTLCDFVALVPLREQLEPGPTEEQFRGSRIAAGLLKPLGLEQTLENYRPLAQAAHRWAEEKAREAKRSRRSVSKQPRRPPSTRSPKKTGAHSA